ncbi:hypothetical protein [Arthrobacter castelli]|uniref:hypothetical protein n=1 Tax=Arthrobacter castelli TaxID=271431 RepID=UPI0012DF4347|nr:hypothetical protein [Arthrobacter castelli]
MNAGLTDRSIQTLVRGRKLVRLRRGSYIETKAWKELTAEERSLQHVLAYERNSPKSGFTVYSHTTAALLHGLFLLDTPNTVHISRRARTSTKKVPADVRRHVRTLPQKDIITLRSRPVTTLERTLVDCAAIMDYQHAMVIGDHAARLGASPDRVRQIVESMSGHRGIRNIRRVVEGINPLSESPGETITRILLKALDVPMPELQVPVRTRNGRHRLDFAWSELKVALEFDGDSKYFDYRPTKEALVAERKRERELMEEGWIFVRLEWKDLFHPREVEARIKSAFARAARLQAHP